MRAFANSNNTMLYNLLGFLPAPSIYGVLSQYKARAGIAFLMFYPLFGLVLITTAALLKHNQVKKLGLLHLQDDVYSKLQHPTNSHESIGTLLSTSNITVSINHQP
jgi:hypothetical protein